ncbi:MAG: hypothetical protein HUU38_05160 [Anaerolineales bacterium]|nr:hypothetical protein [Anaerolineales bacterium]
MEILSKFATPGILFLSTLAFGFWLSSLGKPYNGLLFNAHKLIALGAVISAAIQAYHTMKVADISLVVIAMAVVSVLCVIALFATGAFMSIGNLPQMPLLTVHRIALIILPLALAAMVYFLA